ncbi:MAG: AAA domain-containing protein [Pirellulales bacterium]
MFQDRLEAELEREEDGQFMGLLVKNLVNIQGDERDIIILSICYGPAADRKMRMNFGPINVSGGEKRLNVAFSRAKRHMVVVSSMTFGHITNDFNDGANCLKKYLQYAEAVSSGNASVAQRTLQGLSRWRQDSCATLHAGVRGRNRYARAASGERPFAAECAADAVIAERDGSASRAIAV